MDFLIFNKYTILNYKVCKLALIEAETLLRNKTIFCEVCKATKGSSCRRLQKKVCEQKVVAKSRNSCKKKSPYGGRLKNGKRPTSHRSTTYLCCVPTLEEFAGAGRVGLAVANIQSFCIFASALFYIKIVMYIAEIKKI